MSSAQEIERTLARLGDTAGHAGFKGSATVSCYECLDFDMHTWRKGRAVYEEPVLRVAEQTFGAGRRKDPMHGSVVGYDREHDACDCCNAGRALSRFTP